MTLEARMGPGPRSRVPGVGPSPTSGPDVCLSSSSYICRVWCEGGEIEAVRSGRLTHRATSRRELPAVGDWVMVRKRRDDGRGAIIAVLPRRSWFSRRMAGPVTDEQVVAANVDVVFIVMSLDFDFSLRRLERYLLLARESGASPVVRRNRRVRGCARVSPR